VEYLIGLFLSLAVAGLATIIGLDRERAFYPRTALVAGFLFGVRFDSRRSIGRALDEAQASHALRNSAFGAAIAEGELNAGRKSH
jgi:hypothetical protein